MKQRNITFGKLCCLLISAVCQCMTVTGANDDIPADSVKSLRVGDIFPDIPLLIYPGKHTPPANMRDYRNKLVILDFWHTGCGLCIKAIPDMMQLQAEFPNELKVLFVNMWDTEEQIESRLQKYGRQDVLDYFANSHSLVMRGNDFRRYFPKNLYVPHHLWISREGRILGAGAFQNSNARKVREYLAGIPIEFKGNLNTSVGYDGSKSLEEISPSRYLNGTLPRFMITPFNNSYSAFSDGVVVEGKVDRGMNLVRDTYLNQDILALFSRLIPDSILNTDLKIAYSTNRNSSDYWLDFVSLPVGADTLGLTTRYQDRLKTTDYDIRGSTLCYEQQTPMDWTAKQRRDYMLANLNAFLKKEMGLKCLIKKQQREVYQIIRTSDFDKISSRLPPTELTSATLDTIIDGRPMINYRNWAFSDQLTTVFTSSLFQSSLYRSGELNPSLLIIDETGFTKSSKNPAPLIFRVDMTMPIPADIKCIADLRTALLPYDLDVRKVTRAIEFISFVPVD